MSLRIHPVTQIVWLFTKAMSASQLFQWHIWEAAGSYCCEIWKWFLPGPIIALFMDFQCFSALQNQLNNYQLNMNKTSDANVVTNKGLWGHSISCTSFPFLLSSPFCTIFRIACLILAYPVAFKSLSVSSPEWRQLSCPMSYKKCFSATSSYLPDIVTTF